MLTDGQTDGKPDPYIAPCLRQARQSDDVLYLYQVLLKYLIVSELQT